jgi:hypothetical protein
MYPLRGVLSLRTSDLSRTIVVERQGENLSLLSLVLETKSLSRTIAAQHRNVGTRCLSLGRTIVVYTLL